MKGRLSRFMTLSFKVLNNTTRFMNACKNFKKVRKEEKSKPCLKEHLLSPKHPKKIHAFVFIHGFQIESTM